MKRLTRAIDLYRKVETNSNSFEDLSRLDMHFRLKDASDMIIEESGLHVENPFSLSLLTIAEKSKEINEPYKTSIEILQQRTTQYVVECGDKNKFRFDKYLPTDPDLHDVHEIKYWLIERIAEIRHSNESFEAYEELRHRKQNLFEILLNLENQNISNTMLKTFTDALVFTNECTLLQSVYENDEKGYKDKIRTYSIGEVLLLMQNSAFNLRAKTQRPLILPYTGGNRLTGDEAYLNWNGLQIFDIDLKKAKMFVDDESLQANEIRDKLFEYLKRYHWFLGITLSASGRGLHVYTKVSRMHHITNDDAYNIKIQKFWYRTSYIHKYAILAYYLNELGIEVYSNSHILDSALAKPQQGIAINFDKQSKWSTNFVDCYPVFLFYNGPTNDINDWLLHDVVLKRFSSWFNEFAKYAENPENIEKFAVATNTAEVAYSDVETIDIESMSTGSRYNMRWKICNNIAAAFGNTDYALGLCKHILQVKSQKQEHEIESFFKSAILHNKQGDIRTIRFLQKLGVKIQIPEDETEKYEQHELSTIYSSIKHNNYHLKHISSNTTIVLNDNEYLGMRQNEIINSLKLYKINLIESAPNTGKTEFFKHLAKTHRVCLVIPFTSTIESKIENDESIRENFDVFYGKKHISSLKQGRSAVMTFDKFSQMSKEQYTSFDYIVVDESHLLFVSTYRLDVVSDVVENSRTYLLNDNSVEEKTEQMFESFVEIFKTIEPVEETNTFTKFIMMTGTITGDVDYWRHYDILNYIKVEKKHPYHKQFDIHITKTAETAYSKMVDDIAENIRQGKKVIHPTNNGDIYAKQIVALVEEKLQRTIVYDYYKRRNENERFVRNINEKTTVDSLELLFCSDYLSVGVDIKDTNEFAVVYDTKFGAEEIEQFNNRLRSTHIHSKIFFPVIRDGEQANNVINLQHIEYVYTAEMRKMIIDEKLIAQIARTLEFSTESNVMSGLKSKYYVEDISGAVKYRLSSFEIEQFDTQFSKISASLLYIKTMLATKYQYNVNISIDDEISNEQKQHEQTTKKDVKINFKDSEVQTFLHCYDLIRNNPAALEDVIIGNFEFEKNPDELTYEPAIQFNDSHKTILLHHREHLNIMKTLTDTMRSLLKCYSTETLLQLFDENISVRFDSAGREKSMLNKTELDRIVNLCEIITDDENAKLSELNKRLLRKMYAVFEGEDNVTISKDEYAKFRLQMISEIQDEFETLTGEKLQSERRLLQISKTVDNFVKSIATIKYKKNEVHIELRKLLPFDSPQIAKEYMREYLTAFTIFDTGEPIAIKPKNQVETSELHFE